MRRAAAWSPGLALLLLAGCGGPGEAPEGASAEAEARETLVKEAERGPVKLKATLAPAKPRLSDYVTLLLEIRAEPEVEVHPPSFSKALGDFLIHDFHELPAALEDGQPVRRLEYELEPAFAGPHLIRALAVDFTDRRAGSEGDGKTFRVELDPLEVPVSSSFADGPPDLAKLEPMREPVGLPAPPSRALWLACAGAGVAGLAALLILLRRKRAAETERRRSAEEVAYDALNALKGERLPEQGRFADFYVRLTGIVRRYIEAKTGIRAPEQTTAEFLRATAGDARFDPEQKDRLRRFLEASDLVKYAAQRPRTEELEDAFERAQQFVGLSGGRGLWVEAKAPEPADAA
ncbi:MAG: hypothetical protein M5U26_21115 [Planctomycetota bacterium]|nr:hypothetical protein [Planctomycetota bacterium]